jgi:hypothetical protein
MVPQHTGVYHKCKGRGTQYVQGGTDAQLNERKAGLGVGFSCCSDRGQQQQGDQPKSGEGGGRGKGSGRQEA